MTHRSSALAAHREKDRTRQRRRRERLKEEGVPMPHVVDNAVTESVSYALALALAGKDGVRAQPGIQSISFQLVFRTSLDILTKRMRYPPGPAATALKARLAKRPEHSNHYWVPHFPSCEPGAMDMSTPDDANTPVTPSGQVPGVEAR